MSCAVTLEQYQTYVGKIERFSFECRKVIGFPSTDDWLKHSKPLFIQSEVKTKPIVIRSHSFSRASRWLPWVLIGSLYCPPFGVG